MTRTTSALALAVALLGADTALADRKPDQPVAGKFAARFDLVSSNCKETGMNLDRMSIELGEPSRGRVAVTMPMVPNMSGVVSRGGKFKAEARRGKAGIEGLEGQFSIAGRVEGETIQFLFIAEYYRAGKALCTQSWNASGPRT
jgi:hypothetical protein